MLSNWRSSPRYCYEQLGRPDEAIAQYRRALAIQPDHIAQRELARLNATSP